MQFLCSSSRRGRIRGNEGLFRLHDSQLGIEVTSFKTDSGGVDKVGPRPHGAL